MKRLVFSEKENKYVELEFTLDKNNQKVYNDSISGYDSAGNPIIILSSEEREKEYAKLLNKRIDTTSYAKERLEICKSCDSYTFKVCKECMCFLPLKVVIKNAECPKGKWSVTNDEFKR